MKRTRIASILCTLAAGLLSGRTALATHKAWVLKNGAADCTFANPDSTEYSSGPITNNTLQARTVICPVALSARWGSTASPLFSPPRWAAAMSANVYLYKAGNTPSCWAVMSSGSVFRFSQTIWATSTVGPQKIAVASQNNWGGELEANQAVTARSLDFVCSLPGADISGNTYLYGYKVKICQTNTGCSDGLLDHDDGVDSREGLTYVQTSGFECSPQEIWDAPYIRRSLDGIAAVSSATFGPGVFCPITPPADDSYEHHRATSQTRVYYKGGSTSSDCVQNRTCPECYLEWWDRDGNLYQSAQFVVSPFQGYVMQATDPGGASNPANMGTDVQAGMLCWLPPGVTLNGINAVMSLTRVSGGI